MASYDVARNICQTMGAADGNGVGVFNNTDLDLVQGTKLGNSRPLRDDITYPSGSSPVSGGGIVVQAVQTTAGKYVVQARGGVANAFAFKKEDFGGVSVILQPFGSDGESLEGVFPHAPFRGTTEAPHDSEAFWFKPIAPFTISPAGAYTNSHFSST